MPTTWLGRCLPVLPLVLVLGCGESSQPLVPVTGKVTYRGQPLQNGTIVFTPDPRRGPLGNMAMGEIKADGTYSLRTEKAFGTAPGYYRVTVAVLLGGSVQPSLLPEKYCDPDLSGLTCEIKGGFAQAIDFNLN